jgi:hypothetical protein
MGFVFLIWMWPLLSIGLVVWLFVLLTDIRQEVRELRRVVDPASAGQRDPSAPPAPGSPARGLRGFLG